MGQQVGTAIGFVAGFFLPGGPQVWAGIGGMVGGIIKPEIIPGPKIGEITQQTASEGGPRPIIFGRSQPIAGNIIVDSEPRIIKGDVGKGGPKQEAPETALRTYAVGVCRGPITAFLQVWRNGTLVYDVEDPGMEADNAEFLKYARFYLGEYDQMPSPDLEAVKGVGEVHGYRGTAYMVLADEDTTDQRGMWSQWQFRLARIGDPQDGRWWAITFGGEDSDKLWRSTGNVTFGDPETRGPPNVDIQSSNFGSQLAKMPGNEMILFSATGEIERYAGYTAEILPTPTIETIPITGPGNYILRIRGFDNCAVATSALGDRYYIWTATGGWGEHFLGDDETLSDVARLPNDRWVTVIANNAENVRYAGYSTDETPTSWNLTEIEGNPGNGTSAIIVSGAYAVTRGDYFSGRKAMRTSDGIQWFEMGELPNDALSGQSSPDGTLVFADTNTSVIGRSTNFGASFDSIDVGQTNEVVSFGNSTWVLSGEVGGTTGNIKVSHDNAVSFEDYSMPGEATLWKVMFANPPFDYRQGFYSLPQLITELSAMVSMDASMIDVSLLDGYQVRGLTITNTYPAYKVLETLSQFFFFMPSNVSGRVKFVPFGGDTVATITEDDLIYDPDTEIEEDTRRSDPIVIPPKLHLNYFDIQGGLNTDKQSSERPRNGRNYSEQSMQTPVSSTADEAATVVAKIHAMMVEQQRGEFHFSLPDNWLFLTESDPVFFQWQGRTERLVINQVDTQDGQQDYRLIRDRQSIHSLSVEGYPPAPVTRPPSRVIGPTLIEFLDIPILRDAHDMLGFYIAISGVFPAWRGAQVELSLDGGQNYIDGIQTGQSTTMGSLVTPLGDHPQAFPDEVNSCQVAISTPDGALLPSTLTGMMNRANLAMIGDEMVNFATVDETSEGLWELSYFLRGRKGTETMEHEVGERFVMLDNVFFVPAELTWLNQSLTFRATSLGTSTDEATVITVTFTGQSQTERQPAYLQAHRDGTDVVASWQGVGRLGGGVNVAMGAHFAGYRVTLTDGTVTQTHDTAAEAITTSLSAFTGPVTVRVQQRNNFTGLGPYIEVII